MDPVSVRFRDCACPGTPHPDGDVAYLRPHLNFTGGVAVVGLFSSPEWQAAAAALDQVQLTGLVGPVYLLHGMVGWNLLDADGQPVPFSAAEAVDSLPFGDALELVDKADDLYGQAVLGPLARRTANSSPSGPTNGSSSTSPTPSSSPKRRSRSARSSAATASTPN